ncbi:MAG: hypothetical protein Q8S18_03420 [Bacteroidales bacterium]|nr:hypothetical protein [Bacteroidales bacterium]
MKNFYLKRIISANLLICSLLLMSFEVFSQQKTNVNYSIEDPTMELLESKLQDVVFGNKIAAYVHQDEVNDYYVVNFSGFSSRYEQVFFAVSLNELNYLTSISSDFEQGNMWFSVNRSLNKKSSLVIEEIDSQKQLALASFAETNADQRRLWLIEFDKFNNSK